MEIVSNAPPVRRSPRTAIGLVVVAALLGAGAFAALRILGNTPEQAASTQPAAPSFKPMKLDVARYGARVRVQIRHAQNSARNGLIALEVYYIDTGGYDAPLSALGEIEPQLRFVAGASADAGTVSVWTTPDRAILAVQGGAGTCVALGRHEGAAVTYASAKVSDGGCRASAFQDVRFRRRW